MTDLIARIAAGEGDNAEVLTAMGFERVEKLARPTMSRDAFDYWIKGDLHVADCRPLTSVDDALRLVPAPWRLYTLLQFDDGTWYAALYIGQKNAEGKAHNKASTAARALVCAILRTRETTDAVA